VPPKKKKKEKKRKLWKYYSPKIEQTADIPPHGGINKVNARAEEVT
jgi:hypothetical protein